MERPGQDLLLGLVFFGGLGLLLWATVALTGFSFTPPETLELRFARADGLRAGDPVFVLGNRMGQVQSLRYVPDSDADRRIHVTVLLDERVVLAEDFVAAIEDGSLLGGKQIDIDPGLGSPVPPDRRLDGVVRGNGISALGDLLGDPELQADVKGFVAGLRQAIDRVNSGETSIGKLFTESRLYDELVATIESARRSLAAVEQGQGVLGRIIHDPQLGASVNDTLTRARDVVARVDRGEGVLGQMTVDGSQLTIRVNEIVAMASDTLRDLREGRGGLGQLLSDPETAAEIRRITAGFASLADKVNDPAAGLVGELVSGRELRATVVQLFDDLGDVAAAIRNGKGLLSRVVYDESMGEQLSRVFTQVSRAIEDAREAAPIGTFFQVFSAAF